MPWSVVLNLRYRRWAPPGSFTCPLSEGLCATSRVQIPMSWCWLKTNRSHVHSRVAPRVQFYNTIQSKGFQLLQFTIIGLILLYSII